MHRSRYYEMLGLAILLGLGNALHAQNPVPANVALILPREQHTVELPQVAGTNRLFHDGPVYAVLFSPDGKQMFSASKDGTLRLWDTATGKEVSRFEAHKGGVYGLSLTRDGKTLVSAGRDGQVRLWETATGKQLRQFQVEEKDAESVAISPDGRWLVGGNSGLVGYFRIARQIKVFS